MPGSLDVGVVYAVVRLGQALLAVEHQRSAVLVHVPADVSNLLSKVWLGERLEAVSRCVAEPILQC